MEISLLAFVLAFALAFANGTNDVSKAIATLVGSGVTDYRSAIAWGTAWTVIGAGLAAYVASAMMNTFGHGLIQAGTIIGPTVTLAVLTGAIAWILFASRTGFPVSTTHALTGAIVGAGFVAFAGEGLIWSAIGKKIALPLLLSPFLAFTVSLLIHPAVRTLAEKVGGGLSVRDAGLAGAGGDRYEWQHQNPVSSHEFQPADHGNTVAMRPRRHTGVGCGDRYDSLDLQRPCVVCPRYERCAENRRHALARQRDHYVAQRLVPTCRLRGSRHCDGDR